MSRPTVESVLTALSTEREPVRFLWARLGCTRAEFQQVIRENYNDLVIAGMRLYIATTSQASALRLQIDVDGIRYSHISIDVLKKSPPMGTRLSEIVDRTREWL
jgi:hypothetical protein